MKIGVHKLIGIGLILSIITFSGNINQLSSEPKHVETRDGIDSPEPEFTAPLAPLDTIRAPAATSGGETEFLTGDPLTRSRYGPNELEDYTLVKRWDFEGEDVDHYTDEEVGQDFNYVELYSHNRADIVMDEINGSPTKVMRITHPAETVHDGFEMQVDLGQDYNELYLSYNFKFGQNFNSTEGGKMPGLSGLPALPWPFVVPTEGHGFWAINMFKPGGRMISYHRDRTTGWVPWAVEQYDYNPIYFLNGCWYNITQRLVINSIDNGVPQANGIKELWVDGRLIFQIDNLKMMQDDRPDMKIDAFLFSNFYGGDPDYYKPNTQCYGYIDNITAYIPNNDPVTGRVTHDPSLILETPDEITDRRVYYDDLITSEGKIHNSEFGGIYSGCIDEAYLIDAGEGNTVTLSMDYYQIGSKDHLFIYDGNTTDSKIVKWLRDGQSGSGEVVESSGRYLFVRFSTNKDDAANGWEATVSMSQGEVDLSPPSVPDGLQATSVNTMSISISWAASTDNRAVTGYRIYQDGTLKGSTTTTAYNVTGLEPNTTYDIEVSAFDAASNESAHSAKITETTQDADVDPPTVPDGLQIVNVTGNSIQVSWNPSEDNEGIAGYNIYVDGTWVGTILNNTFTVSQLEPNTTYSITVLAFDAMFNSSEQSDPIIGTTGAPDNEPPSVPRNVESLVVSSSLISLQWETSTDNVQVTGYNIYVNDLFKGRAFSTLDPVTYTITDLAPGITYNIEITAYDGSGNESARSEALTEKTVNPDLTLDPKLPSVNSVGQPVKSISSISSLSVMRDLGHTELQDYGIFWSENRSVLESANGLDIAFNKQGTDSVAHPDRVIKDLQMLYDFSETNGDQVLDRSNVGTPVNLTINRIQNVFRVPGKGLKVVNNTLIASDGAPSKLNNAVAASNEFTLEAWIKPSSLKQSGPARIVTLSSGPDSRAFTLGQAGSVSEFEYAMRLQTSGTDLNGLPEMQTDQDFFSLGLHHVVYTRNSSGEGKFYVNNVLKQTETRPGAMNWAPSHRFALANEITEDRPWNGTYYLVAVYSRALTPTEIDKNYQAGFAKVYYTTEIDGLETNKPYYMQPFIRTDQGIIKGVIKEFQIANVLHFQGEDTLDMGLVPNPSDGSFKITFEDQSNTETRAVLRISNMMGIVVFTNTMELGSGVTSYEKEYNLQGMLKEGIYSVMLILGDKTNTQRLYIQRH